MAGLKPWYDDTEPAIGAPKPVVEGAGGGSRVPSPAAREDLQQKGS
jgi:hypothetical protein